MRERILTRCELNRALLERQFLLRRSPRSVLEVVDHLVGLQAQDPQPPYLALWSRMQDFRTQELADTLTQRTTLRTWMMRGTIHLVTANDAQATRPVLQSMLIKNVLGAYGPQLQGIDVEQLASHGRRLLEQEPLTDRELGDRLIERWPDHDRRALSNAVRAVVPAVQVTPRGVWGASERARHTTVEGWLGRPIGDDPAPDRLVLRYLAAFGPATIADVRMWSGLTGLGPVLTRLRPELRTFHDEAGRQLFDLPDGALPGPDVPAPPRLLPRFDNVLLAHADRSRIIDPAHRGHLASKNGMPPPAFLVDGRVAGTWRIDTGGSAGSPSLELSPFDPSESGCADELVAEATGMLRLVSGDAEADDVRWA